MFLSPNFIAKAKEKGIETEMDSKLITFKFTSMEDDNNLVIVDNNAAICDTLQDLINDYFYLKVMNDSSFKQEEKPKNMDMYLFNFKLLLTLLVNEI